MAKIGVIDSGYGGLSFIDAYAKFGTQNHTFIYVGDNKRAPYGVRTLRELEQFTTELIKYLIDQHQVEMIVVACGTIATNLLTILQRRYSLPIYGISQQLLENEKNWESPIGVIATEKTVSSQYFQTHFTQRGIECVVISTQEFVAMVEQRQPINQVKIAQALAPVAMCSTLILGCTHFPFLLAEIQKSLPHVSLVDPALALVEVINQQETEETTTFVYITSGRIADFQHFLVQNNLPKGEIWHEDFTCIK